MVTYKNTIKLFVQTLSVSVPYLLLLAAENVFLFRLLRSFVKADPMQAQPIYFISDLNYLCVMGVLFFVFITYEFMRKGRSAGIDESLRERAWIVEGNQFLVLGTMVLFYVVIFGCYMMIGYAVLEMPVASITELGKVLAVNVALASVASVGMGYLISRISNRFAGYFIILFGLLLIVPMTTKYLLKWQIWYGIPVFFLRDWIYILPPDIDAFSDPLYGVPIEGYRIATMLIWIGAGIYFFTRELFRYKRKRRIMSAVVMIIWLAVCSFCISNKGSSLIMGDHPDSAVYEQEDYNSQEKISENPEFHVLNYEMDIHLQHELSAVVKMKLQPEDSMQNYIFTLFHGYHVSKVEDGNGAELEFEQEGDFVTIKGEGQKNCTSITFYYKGNCAMFYSNRNACFLPGFFAYYPRAGAKNVYLDGKYMCEDDYSSHFKISVTGLQTVSNLPVLDGRFEGDSSNVILIGGRYEETEQDGTSQITYPLYGLSKIIASQLKSESFQQEWNKMVEFYGLSDVSLPDKKKMVVVIPTSTLYNGLGSYYEFEDYVLVGQSISVNEVLKTQIHAEGKEELKDLFFELNLNEETNANEIEMYRDMFEESELSEEQKLHDVFVQKLRERGVQQTAQAVISYLMDETVTDSPGDFLEHL